MSAATVRPASLADLGAIQRIYAHHVLHGLGSFEETPPDVAEMTRRFEGVTGAGFPYLVAERDGAVQGYAYIAPYRPRPAYRYTVENSVYVAPGEVGRGVGNLLLAALIELAEARGARLMVAVIGDSANRASIALHTRHGFAAVGTIEGAGFKAGRWVDVVIMQRPLGDGTKTKPSY
jgi:L-amino acid N-acyltransferase YncA